MYKIKDIMENFNSKKFRTEIHSLYLPGRRTVLPLLVLFGKDTFFNLALPSIYIQFEIGFVVYWP